MTPKRGVVNRLVGEHWRLENEKNKLGEQGNK